MAAELKALIESNRARALERIQELDEKNAWVDLSSKEVPLPILDYVKKSLETDSIDDVRRDLGMTHPGDLRWKKIASAMRTGHKIDAVPFFEQIFQRNQQMIALMHSRLMDQLEGKVPFNSQGMDALNVMNNMQKNTVSIGKELGIFTDPADHRGGNGGVTIVVQTMVPSPSKERIIEAQKAEIEKSKDLLELHRPDEEESA